jgi:hypothetical protein
MLLNLTLVLIALSLANAAWVSHHGMTSAAYQANFDNYLAQGYRLTWVVGYSHLGNTRYAAIWEIKSGNIEQYYVYS